MHSLNQSIMDSYMDNEAKKIDNFESETKGVWRMTGCTVYSTCYIPKELVEELKPHANVEFDEDVCMWKATRKD